MHKIWISTKCLVMQHVDISKSQRTQVAMLPLHYFHSSCFLFQLFTMNLNIEEGKQEHVHVLDGFIMVGISYCIATFMTGFAYNYYACFKKIIKKVDVLNHSIMHLPLENKWNSTKDPSWPSESHGSNSGWSHSLCLWNTALWDPIQLLHCVTRGLLLDPFLQGQIYWVKEYG